MPETIPPLGGIHHVTAIVDDPQQNVDFYTEVLGLRLVKRTVNFEDPSTYHLYYGDEAGSPGTIVTFFPYPDGRHGSRGSGQLSAFAFVAPAGSLEFWERRVEGYGLRAGRVEQRFGERSLALYDPAGLLIELVEGPGGAPGAARHGIAAGQALRGLAGVTLDSAEPEASAAFLTERLGFRPGPSAGNRSRFRLGSEPAAWLELAARPGVPRGRGAVGSIHHVAWRAADEAGLLAWRAALLAAGVEVTPVRDRNYFRSIYFREPGQALFEIASDPPGFTVDEAPARLGQGLMLPAWLEQDRAAIEERLPPIRA